METRYYIAIMQDGTKRLIDATNPAQAVRYIAGTMIAGIHAASARDVGELLSAGVAIEKVGK